jgi:hypothetical protein
MPPRSGSRKLQYGAGKPHRTLAKVLWRVLLTL